MLKGTATIELTDVNTGKKEVYEESNMITNALQEYYRPFGYLKGAQVITSYYPLYHHFDGILLFNKQIPEDPDTIYAPAGIDLVGSARDEYVNNTTDITLGSSNLNERYYNSLEKSMTYVYDFTTAQGNGIINCICLTPGKAGRQAAYGAQNFLVDLDVATIGTSFSSNGGYDYLSDVGTSYAYDHYNGYAYGSSYQHIFLLDTEEDCVYYFSLTASNSIRIIKRRGHMKSLPVMYDHYTTKKIIEQKDFSLNPTVSTSSYGSWNYDQESRNLYVAIASSSSISDKGTFELIEINVDTWAIKQYTITNNTGYSLTSSHSRWAFVYRNYIYIKYSNYIYKININNSEDYIRISTGIKTTHSYNYPKLAQNGLIYYDCAKTSSTAGDFWVSIIDTEENKIKTPKAQNILNFGTYNRYDYIPLRNNNYHYWVSDGGNNAHNGFLMILGNYLCTINNLTRPIEKTSDKTMKITYTIQEVQEET